MTKVGDASVTCSRCNIVEHHFREHQRNVNEFTVFCGNVMPLGRPYDARRDAMGPPWGHPGDAFLGFIPGNDMNFQCLSDGDSNDQSW